ncbi:MAG: S-layer family protein, partial [Saprospiraceae bacterium]|nr:S-layer family protein [Saprospiraceae bacterium]
MLPKYFLGTAVLFGLSFLAAVYFFAPGTAQWTGAVDTDWNNPANWVASSGTPSLPPSGGSIGDFVVIPDVSGTTNRFPQVNNAVVASARSLTVQSGAKVTVNLGGSLNVIGSDYDGVTNYGMITNNGLMYIDSAYNDGLVNLTGSTFTNGGTFTVINGLGNRVENYSNLTNTGTFNVFMGVDTNLINHSGAMIHNDGGTFTVSGGLSARVANRGTIESQATLNIDGATMGVCLLNFSGGRIDIQGGTCSIGSGTDARVMNYGSIENHGTFSINGALNGMGLINYATGNVMTDGDFYVSGGNDQRVANYGTFHNNGALTVSGASSGIGWGNYAGSLMENGVMSSVNISGGNNSQIDNYSQITTSNSFSLSGAGTPNPTMYNHAAGTFDVLGGTVAINYGNATHLVNEGIVNNHGTSMNLNYCAASGLINQPNAVFNHFAGTLEARSMMQDRVINHGILNLYSDAYFTSGLGMNLVNSNTGTVRQKGGILGLENFFGNCFQNDGSFYGSPGTQMYLRYGSGDGLNNNGIFVDSAACQITMEALGNTAINNAGYLQVDCDFIYGGFASYVLNNSDTAIIGPMASFTPSPSYNISRAINNSGYFENGGDWILPPNGYTIVDNSGHAWFTSSSSFTGSHLAYIYPILNNNGLFENDGQFIFRQFDAPLVNNSSLFINRGRLNSSFFANTYQGMVNSDTLINQGTLDLDTINTNGLFNQGVFINDTTGRYVADYIGQNGIQNEIGGVIKNHGEITIGGTLGVGNFAINNHGDVDNCNLMDLGGQGLLVGGGILTGSSFNNRSFGQILINNADSGIISNTDFLNEQCAVIQSLGIIRDNGNFINQGFILKNLDTNSVASNVSVNDGLIVNDDPDPFNVGSGNGFLTNGSYTPPTGSLYNIRTNGEEYSVVCQDRINVSLGSNCQVEITPGMLLTGNPICPDYFQVSLTYPAGTTKYNPANMVDASHRGLELTYNVIDPSTNNRCWGTIVVEDKFPPQILCTNDTISCFFMGQREDLVQVTENCDLYPTRTEVLEKQWTDLGCDDRTLVGYLARKVRATDVWGHFSECRDTLFVLKETIDSLVCGLDTAIECNLVEQLPNGTWVDVLWNTGKDGSTYVDDQGYAHPWPTDDSGLFPAPYLKQVDPDEPNAYLIPIRTDAGPDFSNSGKCQIVFDYEDHVIPTCGKAYKIRRTWHVYDWCGKSDTTCVQWFIVEDHQPPRVMSTMLEDARIYYPEIINIDKLNLSPYVFPASKNIYVSVDPHDCKAGVQLPDVREFVERSVGQYTFYECDDELELYYEVSYNDPTHPGKLINLQGNYDQDGGHLYLPEGWYTILWTIRDRCWNEFRIWQIVYVIDGTPPTPVCDEITQVSLDPEKCWARIYAKDLDDGSHDNCCQQLHFAVANMDSINYWRDYWHSQFENCLDPYDFHHYYQDIEAAIEEWINIFVFDDYIDVTECGSEQLVLRVYEACDLPEYDPHTFYGGEHEWYWWNLSEQFYAWYIYRLNDYIHYGDPRPGLLCEIVERPELISRLKSMISDPPAKLDATPGMSSILSIRWDVPISSNIFCGDDFHDHETYPSPICGLFYQNQDVYNEWYSRVVKPYSTEFTTSANLAFYKRWAFPHLYNDCMIEVLKDDKVPPVVQAPEDITVYCDGVPYWWELTKPYAGGTKTATVTGHGAQYTHDVCWNEDYLTSYCSDPYVSVIEAPSGTAAL